MANTFELIYSATVGSGGASDITFNTIPATFTDLCLVTSLRITGHSSTSYDFLAMVFNADTSASYDNKILVGSGSAASSFDVLTTTSIRQALVASSDSATSNTFGNSSVYIPNYAGSTYKSVSVDSVIENNATATRMQLAAGLWKKTNAITSIKLTSLQGTGFVEHSTAYLYGVKNA
jgi:hypothetical protein